MPCPYHIGLDIGSTTVKVIVLDPEGAICIRHYERHHSDVRAHTVSLLERVADEIGSVSVRLCVSGSGGIDIATELGAPFLQEVLSSHLAIGRLIPDADVVIELGGEDAKMMFLTGGIEQRMNETCAGGTGAFIDQIASFIGTDASGLDELAAQSETIYPIASRCGVFARMDILPLLNEGCSREDIAASVFQAVVNQTISGLAHGRKISGKVVFLGGPLTFLPFLQQRFCQTLSQINEAVFPENAEYFVAIGAAFHAEEEGLESTLPAFLETLRSHSRTHSSDRLPPLFSSPAEREAFTARHGTSLCTTKPLEQAQGKAWLGFDSGSTTIKAVLIGEDSELLYSHYAPNRGDPLQSALDILKDIYQKMPPGLEIAGAGATGYGAALLTEALHLDINEVETVAHYTAARFFDREVSFVIDIGGQDIKCMRIKNDAIDRISLNEACSSGCGSFIENFSQSLGIPLKEFVELALTAENPVDLGTRCTVFMNSRVKQAQKEGVALGDIAAGLSRSVIKNACYKVMKITNIEDLGDHVVAQGGAFANDALLRALELELGHPVVRPSVPGLMGALGIALIVGRRQHGIPSSLLSREELAAFSVTTKMTRCGRCPNNCRLTVSSFSGGRHFVSGNRCERGSGRGKESRPNMYDWKYARLFSYYTPVENAPRGRIGIPRALNMYENYPLWFTLLSALGFQVVLSRASSRKLYYRGYATIPSQTVCYPAKLAHGHVLDLFEQGVKTIFFPCLPREQEQPKSFPGSAGNFNCPVVAGYPELLRNNIEELQQEGVTYLCPFLPLSRERLAQRLHEIPFFSGFSLSELEAAVQKGFDALDKYHEDVRAYGASLLGDLAAKQEFGIVLAGHPYHVDPEVHHGIADFIASLGITVLSEDAVSSYNVYPAELRVVDQWTYHSRLYRAGSFVTHHHNLAVLQLFSFGCGLDAITSDQLEELVGKGGGLYAQIKLDEGTNLGAARIRIRSLIATMREKQRTIRCTRPQSDPSPPLFQDSMRKTHTILIPQMSPIHFEFIEAVFEGCGFKACLLPTVDREAIALGLRYVNNDACFPAIVVIGQLLQAVQSGRFDKNSIALLIPQTGGGCRATNYAGLLRKAMVDAGLGTIPILSLATGIQGPGIRMTRAMLFRMIMAGHYGDALSRMINRIRPYERDAGSIERLKRKWVEKARQNVLSGNILAFEWNMFSMIRDFDRLPLREEKRRQRVGIVGEILLKYHPDANNHAVEVIEAEGGEVVSTDIMDFAMYCLYDHIFNYRHLAGPKRDARLATLGIAFLEATRLGMRLAFACSKRFLSPSSFHSLRAKTRNLISLGQQSGEGWLLGAEMVRMLESGVQNILCVQPFGCLPNHVVAKGLMRELKRRYPEANFIALDYDPGASEVNQINRIKLMMRSEHFR
ncbi:MAG: acyl-CoA dehydratase activase-related protein [Desulfovibrio sp.]|nr:acyl-CoA dehydratase activase-related protein [Desulfovibrio sp.]